ncbi:MAG: hypothetical protein IKM11_03750 [Oscillospiraceae bacterium]|nr:hypothetical protein [Oscillospiraceae bacterium]
MKHHKPFYAIVTVGVVLFIALLATQHMFREDSTITLPMRTTEADTGDDKSDAEDLNILSITPETVQAAISTLSRPASYLRTQTVTLYWDGGERTTTFQIAVSGGMTRIDTTLTDGSICHTLLSGASACIWYDDDTSWATVRADQSSSDSLQQMPTYETVLELDSSAIVHAEYCTKDDVPCIYITTSTDLEGYAEQFWISAQSGLLYAAERTHNDEVIYRFTATEPGSEAPDQALFLLPDDSQFPAQ